MVKLFDVNSNEARKLIVNVENNEAKVVRQADEQSAESIVSVTSSSTPEGAIDKENYFMANLNRAKEGIASFIGVVPRGIAKGIGDTKDEFVDAFTTTDEERRLIAVEENQNISSVINATNVAKAEADALAEQKSSGFLDRQAKAQDLSAEADKRDAEVALASKQNFSEGLKIFGTLGALGLVLTTVVYFTRGKR